MKERLQYIINNEGLSNLKFAELLGVNPASISHILTERNKPSFDFVVKIAEKLPHYNLRWLLTGNGEPLESSITIPTPNRGDSLNTDNDNNTKCNSKADDANQNNDMAASVDDQISDQAAAPANLTKEKLIVCFPDGTFSEFTKR